MERLDLLASAPSTNLGAETLEQHEEYVMKANEMLAVAAPRFLLRFQSLFHSGRALVFPCDAQGCVFLDALSEKARENYLFARAVVGHEYATPVVLAAD